MIIDQNTLLWYIILLYFQTVLVSMEEEEEPLQSCQKEMSLMGSLLQRTTSSGQTGRGELRILNQTIAKKNVFSGARFRVQTRWLVSDSARCPKRWPILVNRMIWSMFRRSVPTWPTLVRWIKHEYYLLPFDTDEIMKCILQGEPCGPGRLCLPDGRGSHTCK